MPRTKNVVQPVPAVATQLVAANGSRAQLRLTNTTPNATMCVSQNAGMTMSSGGNKVLRPSDCLEVEGAAATAAWYCITDALVPASPTARTDELDPR
jgi:hypothetical protein